MVNCIRRRTVLEMYTNTRVTLAMVFTPESDKHAAVICGKATFLLRISKFGWYISDCIEVRRISR